ncbi:MAG: DUF1802 family protein [Chthoniobacteraceae bacterium]
MSIAFKEWAIICDLLGTGGQSIILRKGGIHEWRDGFSFRHNEFHLFPTLFHEQIARTTLPVSTPVPAPPPGRIEVRQFARVEWTATITGLDAALSLAPFHAWKEEVVRERFHYDEAPGLHLAYLRVFRCEPGWSFPDEPKYGGCRSWVTIPEAPEGVRLVPALTDEENMTRSEALKAALTLKAALSQAACVRAS